MQAFGLKLLYVSAAFVALLFGISTVAASISTTTRELGLGNTTVRVTVYENAALDLTFFAPHHNEQTAIRSAIAAVESRGGRLIVVEAVDEAGRPSRRLRFTIGGEQFSIDPNRIFTKNGRACLSRSRPATDAVEAFAEQLLEIIGREKRMIVAVHNNTDTDQPARGRKGTDLTASAFSKRLATTTEFSMQSAGVFLSNSEADDDNFVLISTPALIGHFAARGFSVVVQKAIPASDDRCGTDDGSFSVYAARAGITYINLEADAVNGGSRQRQMIDAVYELLASSRIEER